MKTFLLILFMNISLQASYILPSESDKEIESVETCIERFLQKGGTLVRLEKEVKFSLLPGDVVFPSCSGANNRSQTLWVLLKRFPNIELMPPHATRIGFDPVYGRPNWNGTKHKHLDDQFILWAGYPKSEKFGWYLFEDWLGNDNASQDTLLEMTAFYDKNYYGLNLEGKRRVYITFAKNAHIHLKRLSETNDRLDNVVVAFFPLDDLINEPLKEWNTVPRSVKSYEELTKLLEPHIVYEK